jgi:hypothetical protein
MTMGDWYRTPLARMLPSVIGGPAWDRGRVLMPGRIFARLVPTGARYCGTPCRTRAKDDRRLALERAKRNRRRFSATVIGRALTAMTCYRKRQHPVH